MEDVFKIVRKLEEVRRIPQFIFIAGITRASAETVRLETLKFIKNNPEVKEIDFILESPGGSPDYAYIIIRTLRAHFEKVNIIVAYWAKSAATLLSFGGSNIVMDEFAEFGPLDMQLKGDEFPDAEFKSALIDEYSLSIIEERGRELYKKMLLDILKEKKTRIEKDDLSQQLLSYIPALYKPLLEKIDPYEIGSKARVLAVGEKYAERILIEFNNINIKDKIEYFVDYIVHECPDHRYIIDYSLISQFLANVHKSSEYGEKYCETLTQLSLLFFKSMGAYNYIGFFDNKLLEKMEEIADTQNGYNRKKEIKKEQKTNEKSEKNK